MADRSRLVDPIILKLAHGLIRSSIGIVFMYAGHGKDPNGISFPSGRAWIFLGQRILRFHRVVLATNVRTNSTLRMVRRGRMARQVPAVRRGRMVRQVQMAHRPTQVLLTRPTHLRRIGPHGPIPFSWPRTRRVLDNKKYWLYNNVSIRIAHPTVTQ